jgi:hypothetical protein
MTNLNASMANGSAETISEREYDYEIITKGSANCDKQESLNDNAEIVQNKLNLASFSNKNSAEENIGCCEMYKSDKICEKESLKTTDFICRNYKNDDIIENKVVDCVSTLNVFKKESVCLDLSCGLDDGQNMGNNQGVNGDFCKMTGAGEAVDGARRSDTENLSPQEQMNRLIQAEREKKSKNIDQNQLKNTENILKNTDSNTSENVIPFPSNSVGVDFKSLAKPKTDLDKLIAGAGGESAIKDRLEKAQATAVEKLKNQSFVAESLGENVAIKPDDFDYSTLIDNAKVEAIFNALKKPYKCDLLNMDLRRANAKNWTIQNWVKFFLKSVKMATFTVKYYDRMFDRQVKNSFYSEHIARFGSIENFFDELTDLMARKRKMIELKSFAKRLYKELSEVEILIVDKLVFGAENIDEIKKHISLRTMYRKADKIVPKLVEFMNARGFTPEWCYQTFGEILN